jgi:predicted NBD/HSP70 family sugar kinase
MGPEWLAGDFGDRGCLETLVSLDAVLCRWLGRAPKEPAVEARALLRAAAAGDAVAGQAIAEAATLIGLAAAHVSVVIDPSLLVLSGPLLGDGGDVLERVRTVVSRVIPRPPRVVCSRLGEAAMIAGSVLVATQEARGRLRRRLRELNGGEASRARAAAARNGSR